MSLAGLTPESVHQAIAEFDRLGRDSFLSSYGFGKAGGYLLIHNGHASESRTSICRVRIRCPRMHLVAERMPLLADSENLAST
jgi:hypothetical protein